MFESAKRISVMNRIAVQAICGAEIFDRRDDLILLSHHSVKLGVLAELYQRFAG
jgi:hypothetical protein